MYFIPYLFFQFDWEDLTIQCIGSFADSVRRRCSVLQWNPDLATQLVVASDEDSSPSLRVVICATNTSIISIQFFDLFISMALLVLLILCNFMILCAALGYEKYNVTSSGVCWAHKRC